MNGSAKRQRKKKSLCQKKNEKRYIIDTLNYIKRYDPLLSDLKKNPAEYYEASLMGGINYVMTLDEMKQTVKDKFSAIKKNGGVISKADFEKIKDRYYLDKPSNKLSRIWGIEYLKKQFNTSKYLNEHYGVPGYVIVADDPNKLKVSISFNDVRLPVPIVDTLENATIYFETIKGRGVAKTTNKLPLTGIGYYDFKDAGNIIEDSQTGRLYIVDTEYSAFDFSMDPNLKKLLDYARKKFRYLNNGITRYDLDIDL